MQGHRPDYRVSPDRIDFRTSGFAQGNPESRMPPSSTANGFTVP